MCLKKTDHPGSYSEFVKRLRVRHSANRPTHPRASRLGSGTSLNGKGIAATCTTTACGLLRDGGIRKYAGLHRGESLRTIGLAKPRALLLTEFPPLKLGQQWSNSEVNYLWIQDENWSGAALLWYMAIMASAAASGACKSEVPTYSLSG